MPVQSTKVEANENGTNVLNATIAKVPMPPQRSQKDIESEIERLKCWQEHVRSLSAGTGYPNASKFLKDVDIPEHLWYEDISRFKSYVRAVSVTMDGGPSLPHVTNIIPETLWISDGYSGTDMDTLSKLGITVHICIGEEGYHSQCVWPQDVAHCFVVVPKESDEIMRDTNKVLVGYIEPILHEICQRVCDTQGNQRLLIHCARGDLWSAMLASAAVMYCQNWSFRNAYDYVRKLRPQIHIPIMMARAVEQWWYLQMLRTELPPKGGHRPFKWAIPKETPNRSEATSTRPPRLSLNLSFSNLVIEEFVWKEQQNNDQQI